MPWTARLSRLIAPRPAPRGLPGLEALRRGWRARASLAYEVPFTDHAARLRFVSTELLEELETALSLRTESEIEEYLESFAARQARSLGLPHAIGTSSGTAALTFALLGLGLKPGDEILVPCYTYAATALAVCAAGGVPVLVDSAPGGPHMDPAALRARLGPRTKGVIAVHLFGGMSDPAPLVEFCRAEGLFLLEDACQAWGLRWQGRPAGSFADAAAFSFNYTKLVSGFGNGGLLVARDSCIARSARALRDPESPTPLVLESRRTPAYLDPFPAACVRAQLRALDRILARHHELAAVYREGLAGLPLELPQPEGPDAHTWHWFVVRTPRRDELRAFLKARGVETRAGFHEPLSRLPALAAARGAGEAFPRAESAWRESLALPIGLHMEVPDARRVRETVAAFFARGG